MTRPDDIPEDAWDVANAVMQLYFHGTNARNQDQWDAYVLIAASAILADRAQRSALAQPSAPEGWVMMPKEPTPEMCDAGMTNGDGIGSMYRAMLADRPLPPVHAQPDGWHEAIQKAAHIASLHSHHALWRGLIPYGWSEDVEKFGCGLAERIANAILEDDNRPLDSWRDFVSDPPPRDGNKVDLWQGGMRVPGAYWSDVQEAWCVDGEFGPKEPTPLPIIPAPTHWRHLPPAPTAEEV